MCCQPTCKRRRLQQPAFLQAAQPEHCRQQAVCVKCICREGLVTQYHSFIVSNLSCMCSVATYLCCTNYQFCCCSTPLGAGSHGARTVAAAAEFGLAWAAPYDHLLSTPARADTSWSFASESSRDDVFTLQSPPQLIKLLMDELQLPRNDKLDHNQLNLLEYISDAFPNIIPEAMYGKTLQDLLLVCQVCRHSLIAEGKCAVSQCRFA